MVFVHGSGACGDIWRYQTDYFPDSHAVNLPGHPHGQALNSVEECVDWLRKYLKGRECKDVILTGHSFGGAIALMYAIEYLQELIAVEPESALVYGYLGDAYALRGDLRTARICYREAFVLAPDQVDLKHIQDNELKEKLEELEADESLDSDPRKWFVVVAQLDGFFEKRFLGGLEELKEWLQQYVDLVKTHGQARDHDLVPLLFYHAMVLSDNASMKKFIKKVDLVEVRQKMKMWHPALFARHMRELEKKESRSKGQFAWSRT